MINFPKQIARPLTMTKKLKKTARKTAEWASELDENVQRQIEINLQF